MTKIEDARVLVAGGMPGTAATSPERLARLWSATDLRRCREAFEAGRRDVLRVVQAVEVEHVEQADPDGLPRAAGVVRALREVRRRVAGS